MGGITKVAGLFFGAWVVVMGCGGHEADATCVPGQSIACVGAGGCASSQVCSADGTRYEGCVCGSSTTSNDDGGLPDGYAPLPPPVGDQGYNAIWIESAPSAIAPLTRVLFLPLFSAPSCDVVPPYGQSYAVTFQPTSAGPSGTFPACPLSTTSTAPCYSPEPFVVDGASNPEDVSGGTYTLSAFDANGIATGQMDTAEGIVSLVVKNCP